MELSSTEMRRLWKEQVWEGGQDLSGGCVCCETPMTHPGRVLGGRYHKLA